MSTDRFGPRPRRRTPSHAGTGLLSAKVTTPATLLAVVLGYGLDGSQGAMITGGLAFLTFPVVCITNALVQYMWAGTLHGPAQASARAPAGPSPEPPPEPAASALPVTAPSGELVELPQAAAYDEATFWGALSPDERRTLLSVGRRHAYR
ncbi:MAG: hypothetical protein ACRDNL_02355, partial [Spirillospora sp.]